MKLQIITTTTACLILVFNTALSAPTPVPLQEKSDFYTFKYFVPQHLIDQKITEEEAKDYRAQGRLRALLLRVGISFPPCAATSWSDAPTDGFVVRATLESHKAIRDYLTREFGSEWRIID